MAGQELYIGLAVSGAATLGGAWWGLHRLIQLRYLLDTPTSKIRSAAQGYTELYGMLKEGAEGGLEGPLTGRPCLWWRFKIEECKGSNNNDRWRVVEKGSSDAWLRLADATGECLINPLGAEVRPATRDVWQGYEYHPRGLVQRSLASKLFHGNGRYRYTEERLHAGEPLYAIGHFSTAGGGRQGLDLATAQGAVIREWKADFVGLLQRFDRDGSGQLEEQEWRHVQLAARLEAEQRHQHASLEPDQHRLAKPSESQPFILSSHGEDEVARRFRWQAVGSGLLCMAGALTVAWLLNNQL